MPMSHDPAVLDALIEIRGLFRQDVARQETTATMTHQCIMELQDASRELKSSAEIHKAALSSLTRVVEKNDVRLLWVERMVYLGMGGVYALQLAWELFK